MPRTSPRILPISILLGVLLALAGCSTTSAEMQRYATGWRRVTVLEVDVGNKAVSAPSGDCREMEAPPRTKRYALVSYRGGRLQVSRVVAMPTDGTGIEVGRSYQVNVAQCGSRWEPAILN